MSSNNHRPRLAALLLSRQPLRPTRHSPWVQAVSQAIAWLKSIDFGVISSTGMQTWELVTAAARLHNLPLTVCDFDPTPDPQRQFDLTPDQVCKIPGPAPDTRAERMAARDQYIINTADLLLPVSVRPNGNMSRHINIVMERGHVVDRRFDIGSPEGSTSCKVSIHPERLNPQLHDLGSRYVVHWTRATSGPWPDERLIDLYRDIIRADTWPRSGFDTLRRILDRQRIIASSNHMPGGVATVSLSGLRPVEVVPLMRWRARHGHMSFEPYGVGIERKTAARLGVKPVEYYDTHDRPPASAEAWLTQSNGAITDWRGEREYRHRGDLDLGAVPPERVIIFCHTMREVAILSRTLPYRVMAMERN